MPYPICSVVAVFMMLVRILNTLPSRIWDILFFLFSGYSKSTVGEMEFSRRLWLSGKLIYPFFSVVAVFMMLVRILNTLPSRIWDILFFLFSGYSKSTVGEMEFSRRLWLSGKLIYPFFSVATIIELFAELQGNYDKQNQTYKNSLFLRNLNAILQKDTHFGGNPLFFPHKILTSSGAKEQKTRNLI